MARKTSSRRWLSRQESDPYVRRARAEGWRSRAVFKLEELDRRHKLLRPGMTVCIESYMGPDQAGEGVKLEEQVLITGTGIEVLSGLPFEAAWL